MSLWLVSWLRCSPSLFSLPHFRCIQRTLSHLRLNAFVLFTIFILFVSFLILSTKKRQSLIRVLVLKIHIILLSFASSVAIFILFLFNRYNIHMMCHWTIRSIFNKTYLHEFRGIFTMRRKKLPNFYGQHWKFFVSSKMAKPFFISFHSKMVGIHLPLTKYFSFRSIINIF